MAEKKLELWTGFVYEVYDPWSAQILGTFENSADAQLFVAAWEERENAVQS